METNILKTSGFLCIFITILFSTTRTDSEEINNSVDPAYIVEQYNNATCCSFVDTMESVELPDRGALKIDLMDSNNLLELSTGPTFAKLIKLPDVNKDREYQIRTDVIEFDGNKYAFFPFIALLDKNRILKGSTGFTRISYVPRDFFTTTAYLHFNFLIDGNSSDSHYILVYTRPKYFTRLGNDALRETPREIKPDEVSTSLNKAKYEYNVVRDEIYGLPASVITIKPYNKWFD